METLKDRLYKTAHRSKRPLKFIADKMGISENYLYRMCLPDAESGVKFPVDKLIPLMDAAENYTVLEHLANMCGFLLVKAPKFKAHKGDSFDLIDDYQSCSIEALKQLKTFFNDPSKDHYEAVNNALMEVMTKSAAAKKFVQKTYDGQLELF